MTVTATKGINLTAVTIQFWMFPARDEIPAENTIHNVNPKPIIK